MSESPRYLAGPWKVLSFDKIGPDGYIPISNKDHADFARVLMRMEDACPLNYNQRLEANLALILAAPDLLEALKSIIGWRELRSGRNEFPVERIEEIAREAIRRAEGGQS